MNYDNVADNEDQLVRDLLEEEQKEKNYIDNSDSNHRRPVSRNNYDDELYEDY